MAWHFEPTRLTARWFADWDDGDAAFAARAKPDAMLQVNLESNGRAYMHAAMSRADGLTRTSAWRELARRLRRAFGVKRLDWEHKDKDDGADPSRAWEDTVIDA